MSLHDEEMYRYSNPEAALKIALQKLAAANARIAELEAQSAININFYNAAMTRAEAAERRLADAKRALVQIDRAAASAAEALSKAK